MQHCVNGQTTAAKSLDGTHQKEHCTLADSQLLHMRLDVFDNLDKCFLHVFLDLGMPVLQPHTN